MKRSSRKRYIIILLMEAILIFSLLIDQKSKLVNVYNQDNSLPGSYFPTRKMEKVFYGNNENSDFTQIVDVIYEDKIQVKQFDITSNVVMIYDISPEAVKLIYSQAVDGDGLTANYIEDFTANREDTIIRGPLQVGTKWEDHIGGVFQIISMNQLIDSPVGKFETLVIKYENDEFNVREYYAKDFGLVKIVMNNYGYNELGELRYKE